MDEIYDHYYHATISEKPQTLEKMTEGPGSVGSVAASEGDAMGSGSAGSVESVAALEGGAMGSGCAGSVESATAVDIVSLL